MRLQLTERLGTDSAVQYTSPVHTRFETDYDSSYVEQPSSSLSYSNGHGVHQAFASTSSFNMYSSGAARLVHSPQPTNSVENATFAPPPAPCSSMNRFEDCFGQEVLKSPTRKRLRFDANNDDSPLNLPYVDSKHTSSIPSDSADAYIYSLTTLYTKRQRTSLGIADGSVVQTDDYFEAASGENQLDFS